MNRFFAVLISVVMGLAASFSAAAVEVAGLYEAEVAVTGQGAAERNAASRAALEQVLVKVSGSAEVLQSPALKPLLAQAEQWVQRYQYRSAPPAAATPGAAATASQLLWVAFDRQTINQRLSEAALPVWGLNRPRTLLWLAVEEGSERYLVGGESRPDLQGMIAAQAGRRGLPLNMPLMDLQDHGGLTLADVWGDFAEAISRASERYQPDAILVGRVFAAAPDKWQSHWSLYHKGAMIRWDSAPGAQNEAIAAGVAGAAEQFAKRYALSLTPEAANSVILTVENVASLTDYARTLKYLQSLDPVAAVQIARVEGAVVSYRLKVRGEPRDLVRSIGWGKSLMAVEHAQAPAGGINAAAGTPPGEENPVNQEFRYRIVP